MSEKINLLVVEDDQFIVERLYKRLLTDTRFQVDFASTEIEAKEKVRCKSYDIAYVDIYLREDPYDRGGIEVIKYLHELKENTSIIVVSASDDIKIALSAYKAGISDFLPKDSIHSADELLPPLEKALANIEYKSQTPYGRFSTVSAYLANPEMTPYWEDKWVRHLDVSYKNFTAALNNGLGSRAPILREKGDRLGLLAGQVPRTAYAYFWSKRLGQTIMVALGHVGAELPAPTSDLPSVLLYERTLGALDVRVFAFTGKPRAEFNESVWDESA